MKTILSLFIAACILNIVQGQNSKTVTYNLVIGTYTSATNKDGIHVYEFNSQTGDFKFKSKAPDVENPTYLTISQDRKHVYSVNETGKGGISAFSFNPASGELTFINRVSSGGNGPCYISVDNKNKFVFAANYGSGSLSAIPLKEDGSLSNEIQFIQNEGGSIDKSRQAGPHVHSAVLSPDDRFLLSADLGTDKVSIYRVDPLKASQPLIPAEPPFISVKPGSGPRHIAFHPNSKFVYIIHEMGGIIIAFDYKNGKLTEKQTITMLAPDFKGRVGAADIHISPDGKFLYGSNRGSANEIVIYSVNKNGNLAYVGRQSTMGKTPRNFVIDPTGNFLLVANQDSNEIIIFKRDQKTGLITPTGKTIQVSKPVCLKFSTID